MFSGGQLTPRNRSELCSVEPGILRQRLYRFRPSLLSKKSLSLLVPVHTTVSFVCSVRTLLYDACITLNPSSRKSAPPHRRGDVIVGDGTLSTRHSDSGRGLYHRYSSEDHCLLRDHPHNSTICYRIVFGRTRTLRRYLRQATVKGPPHS